MPSPALVCGRIHRGQVDVLALNEHLCAAGSDGPGEAPGAQDRAVLYINLNVSHSEWESR